MSKPSLKTTLNTPTTMMMTIPGAFETSAKQQQQQHNVNLNATLRRKQLGLLDQSLALSNNTKNNNVASYQSSSVVATATASACIHPTSRRRQNFGKQLHHDNNNGTSFDMSYSSDSDFGAVRPKTVPTGYCVSINQDGYANMDRVYSVCNNSNTSIIGDDHKAFAPPVQPSSLETRLRPVSGIRNHIRRNLSVEQAHAGFDVMRDTDLVQRISSFSQTLRRLDLSHNGLRAYPRQLACELAALEALDLSGNELHDADLPSELERHQALVELRLDFNRLRRLPVRTLAKCRRLARLSVRNNALVELRGIEMLRRLRYLIVDGNQLMQLDEGVRALDRLEVLDASANDIVQLPAALFRAASLANLTRLSLAHNRLQAVAAEVFMLPQLETLNLAHNALVRLPLLPATYVRATPMFALDLSSNSLVRFYDYLLLLARDVDLSDNRVRNLPAKPFARLADAALHGGGNGGGLRQLKLENNPLCDPPAYVCTGGLSAICEHFTEAAKLVQLNKGVKLVVLGEARSGKTMLAHALEDESTQSNLVEQFSVDATADTAPCESKLIEIHEFYFGNDEPTLTSDGVVQNAASTDGAESDALEKSFRASSSLSLRRNGGKSAPTSSARPTTSHKSSQAKIQRKPTNRQNESITAYSNVSFNLASGGEELSATAGVDSSPLSSSSSSTPAKKSLRIPVTVYDFNGSLGQFGHLMDVFMDKCALVVLCVDGSCYAANSNSSSGQLNTVAQRVDKLEANVRSHLDHIYLRMSKNKSFYVLPVLTKCDKLATAAARKQAAARVDTLISAHLDARLADIARELRQIELLEHISASQSDRLKQLIQTQLNLSADVHAACIPVSVPGIGATSTGATSASVGSIRLLCAAIRRILSAVPPKSRHFPDVSRKVPTFWAEVETFACSTLSEMPTTKYADNRLRVTTSTTAATAHAMDMLCVDYDEYRERIVDKYGMRHMVDQISAYMNASGRVLWYHQDAPERMRRKIFLRPALLFDLLFVLFRTRFAENFADAHTQALRDKLVQSASSRSSSNSIVDHGGDGMGIETSSLGSISRETVSALSSEFVTKGVLHMDLLRLIWCPILITNSAQLLQNVALLFIDFFHIGYPRLAKDKLKLLFRHYNSSTDSADHAFTRSQQQEQPRQRNWDDSASAYSVATTVIVKNIDTAADVKPLIDVIIVPMYLPQVPDKAIVASARTALYGKCVAAASMAVSLKMKRERPRLGPRIGLQYTFPWGLMPGVFERFATNCLLNSDLYYKVHYRDYIYGHNEENSIGALMYAKSSNDVTTEAKPATASAVATNTTTAAKGTAVASAASAIASPMANEVVFEFYLISYEAIIESLAQAKAVRTSNDFGGGANDDDFDQTLSMDMDQIWMLALRVAQLFEETIAVTYPSMRYDRRSLCPECETFSFLGEWTTPKELQKLKAKVCANCEQTVDYSFLVKPTTGKSLTLDLQKMHQRLENVARLHTQRMLSTTTTSPLKSSGDMTTATTTPVARSIRFKV